GGHRQRGDARIQEIPDEPEPQLSRRRVRKGLTQRLEPLPSSLRESIDDPRCDLLRTEMQQRKPGSEHQLRVVRLERLLDERIAPWGGSQHCIPPRPDSLLEVQHRLSRDVGRTEVGPTLAPEETELLQVLLQHVRDEGPALLRDRRRLSHQLISTEPPLMRFRRVACETRSLPLVRILPSSRMVIEPSPTRRVRDWRASRTSSSGGSSSRVTPAGAPSPGMRPRTIPFPTVGEYQTSTSSSGARSSLREP